MSRVLTSIKNMNWRSYVAGMLAGVLVVSTILTVIGSALWSETRQTSSRVQVTNGLFTVQLGEVTPLPASLFNTTNLYFQITMPTPATATCNTTACASWESPMTPRNKLATSAYAFNAATLNGYSHTDFATATGGTGYIQNTTTPQTADFNITGAGTANTLTATTAINTPSIRPTTDGTNALHKLRNDT